jgi:TolB-like protein
VSQVFISYARSTADRAQKITEALRGLGYQVWIDDELPAHRSYTEVLKERLDAAKAVVVVWSAEAVKSEWVQSEADHARLAHKLVQLTVDGSAPPMPFDRIQCADLVGWKGDPAAAGWQKVVESVDALVGPVSQDVKPDAPSHVSAQPKPPLRRWPVALAAGVLVIAIAAGGWWFLARPQATTAPARVAVLPFDTPGGSPGAQAFGAGLQDEILGVLSNDHVETVSRTESAALRGSNASEAMERLGVGFLLDGSVEEANDAITVRLHIDDPSKGAVVWSEAFTRIASESDALQAEVAAKAARVLTQALRARAAGVTDPDTLSDYVTGDEHSRFDVVGASEAAEPFYRRVIARAPHFAGGHATLAIAEAFESFEPGNPRADELKVDARREAEEAIKLDPKGDDAFLALSMLAPPDDWRAGEAPLRKGMALDPTNPAYPYFLGQTKFAPEGRLRAAADALRRAVALDPYWPGPTDYLAVYLMETGQADEGQQLLDRMQRYWPGNWATLSGRFWKEALHGDPDAAAALLADPRTRPPYLNSRSVVVWQTALKALKSNRPDANAAAAVRTAVDAGQFDPAPAVWLLARLGDVDGAFAVADKFPLQVAFYDLAGPPALFTTAAAPMRRDPRFMRLAAKLGLVDYWRSTGNWPDFCSEPGLPYDCKAEAARIFGAAKP